MQPDAGKVDLHCHSSSSTGAIGAPPLIPRFFKEHGYAAFGLTEHDNFESLEATRGAAGEIGIEYIPGIEISAFVNDPDLSQESAHILGFFYEVTPALEVHCRRSIEEQNRMKKEFLRRLREQGNADIGEQELRDHIKVRFGKHDRWKRPFSNGPIGDLLRKRGILPEDRSKTFRDLFAELCPDLTNEATPDARRACDLLREAGASVILAHPLSSLFAENPERERKRLTIWLERYVDGLEVFYEKFDTRRRGFLLDILRGMKRPFTGGSDTHSYDPDASLKWSNAPYACVESLRKFRTTGRCESIPSL